MSAEQIRSLYAAMPDRLARARRKFGRPLTLTDKILVAHCWDFDAQQWERGKAVLRLRVDRVSLQDATGQMALLQFMQSGRKRVAVPTTVHCDHLIRAESGAAEDFARAISENQEVYEFLRSASRKFGIGFWRPGSGIIHQVVLENYAFPGGLMIGADSHTPNGGGLGMLAIGVGGADAAEAMAGLPWEVLHPKLVGVHLTGKLAGWAAPKDVITYLCALLTVKGGTNKVIEYFGPGAESISATGKGTICNMGAELGATTSVFPFDTRMATYLRATDRSDIAKLAEECGRHLTPDPEVVDHPQAFYDEIVEINLDELEPQVVGPHSPDRGRSISKLAAEARANSWPVKITNCLIGSCTNSSYEDMRRAAHLARQGIKAGLRAKVPFLITPGSERIYQTIKRDGIIEIFQGMGGTVLANACGPCIGQWKRRDVGADETNTIVSSFNRNFPGRNDGSAATLSFLTSPEIVTALAFAGTLEFDPVHGTLTGPDGKAFRFTPPEAEEVPREGFAGGAEGYEAPADDPDAVQIVIPPDSQRLQLLGPFVAWDGKDFVDLPILVKTKGKTTTDHISPAGPWLLVRGHLDRISDNMFMGALNAFTGETGKGVNPISGAAGQPLAKIARELKAKGQQWMVVGGENYGEGSSREHAAMSPRYLGCAAVLVRSFARIHETNLKKQGILPLTFADPRDYDRIEQNDRVSIVGLHALEPGKPVTVRIKKPDGRVEEIRANHTMTREQIAWFRAGSALNAGQLPIHPATGQPVAMADVRLRPGDVDPKPGDRK
ncbi:MAG: aconitate hydratase [Candidatus Rokubacteria bacterium 13_1_40CM_69_27]|nr:MAG: aconitate hydratase [Candidatus Rokubacteria bacterium 13_1_40CM_69_27]OLC39379.1 MAG: aconitate hydratase [Candidatus Rokubacteria bacterium 13_1_40CM_4_69_5]